MVWLGLVPLLKTEVNFRVADEALGDAGLHTNTGDARRELCLVRGFPTARLPERGLRENQGKRTPLSSVGGHGLVIVAGERLATDNRHPGYTVLECAPLEPRPKQVGRGG